MTKSKVTIQVKFTASGFLNSRDECCVCDHSTALIKLVYNTAFDTQSKFFLLFNYSKKRSQYHFKKLLALLKLCTVSKGMVTTRKDAEHGYHVSLQKVTLGTGLCDDLGRRLLLIPALKNEGNRAFGAWCYKYRWGGKCDKHTCKYNATEDTKETAKGQKLDALRNLLVCLYGDLYNDLHKCWFICSTVYFFP